MHYVVDLIQGMPRRTGNEPQGCAVLVGDGLTTERWRASCDAKAGRSLMVSKPRLWARSRLRLWQRSLVHTAGGLIDTNHGDLSGESLGGMPAARHPPRGARWPPVPSAPRGHPVPRVGQRDYGGEQERYQRGAARAARLSS
jgi:hypothetical protein